MANDAGTVIGSLVRAGLALILVSILFLLLALDGRRHWAMYLAMGGAFLGGSCLAVAAVRSTPKE